MKRAIVGLFAALFAMVAFALPSPKQIEDALANKNYADAKSLIQEVLREKPDSARAHLMNAYLLIHVDKNKQAANAELQTAVGLDKKGDVKSSPLFGRIVTEIDMAGTPAKKRHGTADVLEIAAAVVLIICALAAVIALINMLLDRPLSTVFHVSGGGGSPAWAVSPSAPAAPSSGGAYYPHAATTIVAAQGNPGMGAFGTAAAVAGGVVAGNAISEMLHHSHHRHNTYDDEPRRESSYSSTPDPSPVSYESERSSFSSGSSDSWSSSDSSSSWSDSSSSSWD